MRKKNRLTRQVRLAYRQDELAAVCVLPERDFAGVYGMETVEVDSYDGYAGQRRGGSARWFGWLRRGDDDPAEDYPAEDYYHFRDNGGRVLAVAHLDTVVGPAGRVPRFVQSPSGPLIRSGALDDRLGAYVILHLLPRLGITCDWLLTVGEESGASTAKHFQAPKDYDWIIEFDRAGTDVVMYQYEDDASREAVQEAGAEMGLGSFSDIAYLEHLGVKAFNWGVGYRGDYHSPEGYAFLEDTFRMVGKYLRFHEANAGTAMLHESGYDRYSDAAQSDWLDCESCGGRETVDPDFRYCEVCDVCHDCQQVFDECMCYVPRVITDDRHTVTWEEYMASRPAQLEG